MLCSHTSTCLPSCIRTSSRARLVTVVEVLVAVHAVAQPAHAVATAGLLAFVHVGLPGVEPGVPWPPARWIAVFLEPVKRCTACDTPGHARCSACLPCSCPRHPRGRGSRTSLHGDSGGQGYLR